MSYSLRAVNVLAPLLTSVYTALVQGDVASANESLAANPNIQVVVDSGNEFALDLYGKLSKERDDNLFFSPQSLATALTMTYAGAEGDTATQIADVLHYDLSAEQLHPAAAGLLSYLNSLGTQGSMQLSVANRLWGQNRYKFSVSFLDRLGGDYQADLGKLDFAQTDSARQVINAWVEKSTAGRIKDLIPSGMLDPLTRLVLTNAVYFKGDWEDAFREADTEPHEFYVSAVTKIDNVPLMHQESHFRYGHFTFSGSQGLKLLQLPYRGQRLSMIVLLPDAIDGLGKLERNLTADQLQQWIKAADAAEVMVWLPKFKMTDQFQLNDVLSAMGMKAAFKAGEADFSNMDGSKELYLSAVIHKAFIKVNEQGTEAAGAVAVVPPLPAPVSPEFRADRPFLFLIREDLTGAILFMGRVVDPR